MTKSPKPDFVSDETTDDQDADDGGHCCGARDPIRPAINRLASGLKRRRFIAKTAVDLAITNERADTWGDLHRERAEWAVDAAEALWDALCRKF
jgi:hypothetical protein